MIAYGAGPAPDVAEVTVFGPGFGEAIAVHLGESHWLLVDSCIDPHVNRPAALAYLEAIDVSFDQVRAIVASHWHDDHVRGLSDIAIACANAELHMSAAFNNNEARALLAAYSGLATSNLSRGTKELVKAVIERQGDVFYAHQRSCVLELTLNSRKVAVHAFSPTQSALSSSIANLSQYLPPKEGSEAAIGNIVPLGPNSEAIALHIELGEDAVLLGSDLEEHAQHGWTAVAADNWVQGKNAASAYKVAHHGSYTGDAPTIWASLLQPAAIAAITPFNLGAQHLPAPSDINRIRNQTPNAYLASAASRKPQMDSPQLKRLSDVVSNLVPINNGFGAIRLRKPMGSASWAVECFGDAHKL